MNLLSITAVFPHVEVPMSVLVPNPDLEAPGPGVDPSALHVLISVIQGFRELMREKNNTSLPPDSAKAACEDFRAKLKRFEAAEKALESVDPLHAELGEKVSETRQLLWAAERVLEIAKGFASLDSATDLCVVLRHSIIAGPIGGIIVVEYDGFEYTVHTESDTDFALVSIAGELRLVRFDTPQEGEPPRGTGTIVSRPEALEFSASGLFHCRLPVCLGVVVAKKPLAS